MKVEFRNSPVFYGSSTFSNVTGRNLTSAPAARVNVPPEPEKDEVVMSNKKKAIIGTTAAVLIGGAVWLISALRG